MKSLLLVVLFASLTMTVNANVKGSWQTIKDMYHAWRFVDKTDQKCRRINNSAIVCLIKAIGFGYLGFVSCKVSCENAGEFFKGLHHWDSEKHSDSLQNLIKNGVTCGATGFVGFHLLGHAWENAQHTLGLDHAQSNEKSADCDEQIHQKGDEK